MDSIFKLERKDTPINVQQLIELLQKFPPQAQVHVEGCDCVGEAEGVTSNIEDIPTGAIVIYRRRQG